MTMRNFLTALITLTTAVLGAACGAIVIGAYFRVLYLCFMSGWNAFN